MALFYPTTIADFKIKQIEAAIQDAKNLKSDIPKEQFDVPALTSIKIRHLLNNIGKIGSSYLEVGVHKGGTFTASVAGNENLKNIVAVDSFESDYENNDKAQPQFLENAARFLPPQSDFTIIVSDSFSVNLNEIKKPVDVYLYDGDHSETAQQMALTYYLPAMADSFIFLCDDYDWAEVQEGTQNGIKKCNLKILFQQHFKSDKSREEGGHDNDSWWNGFYVALLTKQTQ